MNKLLQQQIDRYIKENDEVPANIQALLTVISDSYTRYEKELELLSHSIEQNSKRMEEHASHLEASQRVAYIGSWESIYSDLESHNNGLQYWSDEAYRILGLKPGSVKPSSELFFGKVHPDDAPIIMGAIKRSSETGEAFDVEHRIILSDGTEKIVRERADVVIDGGKQRIVKFIGTIQDITERRKADIKLRKANDELRMLFENVRDVFFTVDMQRYQTTQMSPSCLEVYGYTADDFLQTPTLWIDVAVEEDKGAIWANDAEMRRGGAIINTYRIRHKQGAIKWLETKIIPTLDKDGKLQRIDGVTTDITKKVEAEQALKENEYRFRTFIENSSDAFVVVNETFEIVFASESLFRMVGFMPDEVIGESNLTSVYEDDRLTAENFLKNLLASPQQARTTIYRVNKKNGDVIWTERVGINLINDPVIKGIVINFRNINERKEHEDALKASNEELKKSNGELDRFVYSVSHDLRAPLSSILGIVGLVEVETTDKNIISDLLLIKNNINKLDGFIGDILDYSRNSRLEVRIEKINFVSLIEYIENNLKYMPSSAAKVDILTTINEDTPFYSDNTRIGIILNNLLSNAVRYSNPESLKPFVEINVKSDYDKAVITIKDNGVGISKENHSKVFEMFYRVSKKSVGSGLGLYIVKESIEKLCGTIQMESEIGIGTIFTVTIPNKK